MARETDLAWAAGFIDGEGCVSLIKRTPTTRPSGKTKAYHQANMNVPQIDKAPLLKLQKMFGGQIREIKPTGNRRQSYVWTVFSKSCREALIQMLPYLVVKKKEAKLLLSLDFTPHRLTDEDWVKREKIFEALREHHRSFVYTERGD